MLNFCGGARITQSNLWIFREIQTLLATQSSYLVSHSAPSHRSALNHRTWVAWLSQHDRISCYTDICKINNLPGVGCPFSAGFIFLFQLLWNFMVATEVSGNRINWFPQKKRERKKPSKDVILTALKSENKSEHVALLRTARQRSSPRSLCCQTPHFQCCFSCLLTPRSKSHRTRPGVLFGSKGGGERGCRG